MIEAKSRKIKKYNDFAEIDKWLISRFYSNVKVYFDNMKDLKVREAYINILYEVLSDINYHSRRTSDSQTLDVIRFIFKDYVKVMTPAVPHICEELYLGEDDSNYVSLSNFSTDIEKYIDKEIEDKENIIENIITSISRTKETKNLIEIKTVKIIQASNDRFALFDKLKTLLGKTKEFKKIMPELLKDFSDDKKFIQKFVPKTLGEGLSFYLSKDAEKDLISSITKFIEDEFNCKVQISDIESEDVNIASCVPSKPLIVIE